MSSASTAWIRSSRWASRSSMTPAALQCSSTPASGRTTSTVRPAGWTSTTDTRPWMSPTWSRSCGPSRPSTRRAWPTRATGCCPTAGRIRPRCPTMSCAWMPMSTRTARTPPSPWPSSSGTRTPMPSSGPPPPGPSPPTWPSWSALISSTRRSVRSPGPSPASGSTSPRPVWAITPSSWGRTTRWSAPSRGQRWRDGGTGRSSPTSPESRLNPRAALLAPMPIPSTRPITSTPWRAPAWSTRLPMARTI